MSSRDEISWLYRRKYLRSRDWRRRRWRLVQELRPYCRVCGHDGRVDLHHLSYEHLGHEQPRDVTVLCRRHHRDVHVFIDSGRYHSREAATWAAIAHLKKRKRNGILSWLFG